MRTILTSLLLAALANTVHAAYIIEIDTDGQDDGILTYSPDFDYGGDTSTASQSSSATVFGATGGDSIFGGDGINEPDTYVFTYGPDTQADNLSITAGQDLGDGNLASGLSGGNPGTYRVYAAWPMSSNVSGGDTTYTITTAGDTFSIAIAQNNTGNVWVNLGDINYTSGDITVTQTAGSNTFVSMRAYGVLFEAVPEPATAGLLTLGAALALRRRRQAA